ncbi:uncharacterized protein C594.04c [Cajanus cajan]|uniref:Uncharacterized protein C594.04c family n=1 Tax=Cajanus cajan TaxID=3821 RepID=A0A151TY99_CAJCA|nr:uncharacterized protein C594.04c [Cajanus cajan]KYP72015.1 Uncharacterized protein C594.04c family [Cajanus cajan]
MGCSSVSHSNLKNAIIAFLVPLPSILFFLSFKSAYSQSPSSWSALWTWCYHHPLLLANVLFFFNVNFLFWLIGLIQSTHWMIDPYWTVIPVMLVHYYASHPLGEYNWLRSRVVILLTWVWSIRLIHNYFRREKWQWGAREDWRFTDLSQQYGRLWWWASFFAIYVPHQVLLIGLSLPLHVIHSVNEPLSMWDLVGTVVCICGVVIAYTADTQLYNFVSRKEEEGVGVPILEKGLWYYSRHPNYFGEQVWWWGLVVFAWNLGHGWTFIGALANTKCLAYVTKLVEDRMLKQDNRAEAYTLYQKTTSVWLPCFKYSPLELKSKDA